MTAPTLETQAREVAMLLDDGCGCIWGADVVRALLREIEVARAIIAGRTVPPTDAEIAAHALGTGHWQYVVGGAVCHGWMDTIDILAGASVSRWWPLDASGAPCAWPVVTT